MRSSEADELTGSACLPPVETIGGGVRYRLASKLIKGRQFGGEHEEWVVLEPAYRAAELAIRLTGADSETHIFPPSDLGEKIIDLRRWVNGPAGRRLGLASIPDGPANGRMLRRTTAISLGTRPGGVIAAKIQLKHLSVATTEGYAYRPGGSQARLFADMQRAEQGHHQELTMAAFRDYQEGQMPTGPGARDLIAAFDLIDQELNGHEPGEPKIVDSERRLETLLQRHAAHLHVQAANYCWFRDPHKALCLKLSGGEITKKSLPLAGMCDSAKCSQATHHAVHLEVWRSKAVSIQVLLDSRNVPKGEKIRLQPELDRALRVVQAIENTMPGGV
jgi:hypothetical protein